MSSGEYFTISGANKISQKYGRIRQKDQASKLAFRAAAMRQGNTANLLISISRKDGWRKCSRIGRKIRFHTPATVTHQPRQEPAGARASPVVLHPARRSISALNAHVRHVSRVLLESAAMSWIKEHVMIAHSCLAVTCSRSPTVCWKSSHAVSVWEDGFMCWPSTGTQVGCSEWKPRECVRLVTPQPTSSVTHVRAHTWAILASPQQRPHYLASHLFSARLAWQSAKRGRQPGCYLLLAWAL